MANSINISELVAGMATTNTIETAKRKRVEVTPDIFRRVVSYFTEEKKPAELYREILHVEGKLSKSQRKDSRAILSSVALQFAEMKQPENFPHLFFGKFSSFGGYRTVTINSPAEWGKAVSETLKNLPSNVTEGDED